MITEATKNHIAKISWKPIMKRLKEIAAEQVAENLCLPDCGIRPDGEFCSEAKAVFYRFLLLLIQEYGSWN